MTVTGAGHPLDLGCGWLHSADRNPWTKIFAETGFTIEKTPPGWHERGLDRRFSPQDHETFGEAFGAFYARLAEAEDEALDQPAANLLEPGGRFNALIGAIITYISGAELEQLSVRDMARYADSEVNWRVVEGYGAGIAAQASRAALPVELSCHVSRIDHAGPDLRLTTAAGTLRARAVIVTVPPNLLLTEKLVFDPPLPEKSAAAAGLPLGLANKLFMRVDAPELLPIDGHVIGRTDKVATAGYHLRPFGRDLIEGFFGGNLARDLEKTGEAGFFAFASEELANLFGADIRARLQPVAHSSWAEDPYAGGSYSYALPGHADARGKLAESVEDRIFFAGEACSAKDFSTAHGAYLTGIKAAEEAITVLARRRG